MSKVTYLIKILFVTVFVSLLYFVINYFMSIMLDYVNIDLFDLACYLGVFQAINIFFAFAISSYIANNLISFFRN